MKRERLDWILSGLNQYNLTDKESQFIKAIELGFNQNGTLTDLQEEKIEAFYKEKSRLIPNKGSSTPKTMKSQGKGKMRRPHGKIIP